MCSIEQQRGQEELRQLAHLLRVGADAAREIAAIRPRDFKEICGLAQNADVIAAQLDAIASRPEHYTS